MTGVLLWLLGFPNPVIEFFLLGVTLFLVTSLHLARNMERFEGIEGEEGERTSDEVTTGGD